MLVFLVWSFEACVPAPSTHTVTASTTHTHLVHVPARARTPDIVFPTLPPTRPLRPILYSPPPLPAFFVLFTGGQRTLVTALVTIEFTVVAFDVVFLSGAELVVFPELLSLECSVLLFFPSHDFVFLVVVVTTVLLIAVAVVVFVVDVVSGGGFDSICPFVCTVAALGITVVAIVVVFAEKV